ncbi:hypothetical protein DRQ26_01665 [bacterium]|nr:MAG: hypothetical protein DRQ26_01665 [bacterium]
MLTILVILLGVGVVALTFVIIMMWNRMSRISIPSGNVEVAEKVPDEKPVSADEGKISGEEQTPPEPVVSRKPGFLKPKIPQDARIEQLTKIYSDMPGILGAIFADRFGQTIASDTNLILDRVAIPAYFIEILELTQNERLPMGKPVKMFICGEGSYWIFGDIAGMPWGLWLEHEIDIKSGAEIADSFREDIIKVLKANYTRIW